MALLIMSGVIITGAGIAVLIIRELKAAQNTNNAIVAFYAAESAVEESLHGVRKLDKSLEDLRSSLILTNGASWQLTAFDKGSEIKEAVVDKGRSFIADLYNSETFETEPSLGIALVKIEGKGIEGARLSYQEFNPETGSLGEVISGLAGETELIIDPAVAYRVIVKAEESVINDLVLTGYDNAGERVDLPIPVTIDTTGRFSNSKQGIRVTIPRRILW